MLHQIHNQDPVPIDQVGTGSDNRLSTLYQLPAVAVNMASMGRGQHYWPAGQPGKTSLQFCGFKGNRTTCRVIKIIINVFFGDENGNAAFTSGAPATSIFYKI